MTRNDSARVQGDTPRRRKGTGLATMAALVLMAAGCGGDNIFVEGTEDQIPPEVHILEPLSGESVAPDDSVLVRVAVSDRHGVTAVTLEGFALRGDPALGTQVAVTRLEERTVVFDEPVTDTTVLRYLYTTDEPGSELVYLIASARDAAGNVGADTLEVTVGGPRVALTAPVADQVVRQGMRIPIQVQASDPAGVNLISIQYGGVVEDVVEFTFAAVTDTVLNTTLTPPSTGQLEIRASARNTDGLVNHSRVVSVQVASATDLDDEAPRVGAQVFAPERVELTDSVRVAVSAVDEQGGTGVVSVGVTALASSVRTGAQLVWHRSYTFDAAQGDQVTRQFHIPVDSLYMALDPNMVATLPLPDTLEFEFHAVAHDAAGNCSAATGTTLAQGPCGQLTRNGLTVPVAANTVGQRKDVAVVAGQTVGLPSGGLIADAVIDPTRRQLFLSNFTYNRVEMLDLASLSFRPGGIPVGAQPWGMTMHKDGDTLIVANSGGTNLDFVHLDAPVLRAELQNRVQTPNIMLFQITQQEDDGGFLRFTTTALDFSDRPQFVAQDINGALLYSTVPTAAASDGTVRRAWRDPSWDPGRWQVDLILTDAVTENPDGFAVARVDSVFACTIIHEGAEYSGVRIYDRITGSNEAISSGCAHPVAAAADVAGKGSNVLLYERVVWDRGRIGLTDTTFVAASGDRRRVVFGEGARNQGRIMMWYADAQRASNAIEVTDLIHNEPARISGVDLNFDGTMGVARGDEGAYYFNDELRLLGRAVEGVGGGAGAAMHPSHTGTGHGLSFVGTNRNSIQVIDVVHFMARGEIPIRDQVVGPLKVSAPLPGDPTDTVVRVYAVTSSGGVVLVRVRESDITP